MKKGLRPVPGGFGKPVVRIRREALMKKGLRHVKNATNFPPRNSERSPDEEGIKTAQPEALLGDDRFGEKP